MRNIFLCVEPDEVAYVNGTYAVQTGEIIFNWGAPRTNKGDITRYEMIVRQVNSTRIEVDSSLPNSPTELTVKLAHSCCKYVANIAAFTSAGKGPGKEFEFSAEAAGTFETSFSSEFSKF